MNAKVDFRMIESRPRLSGVALRSGAVALCVEDLGGTYPLSMTRAATSSALMEDILLAVVLVIDGPSMLKVKECGEKEQRSAYLP